MTSVEELLSSPVAGHEGQCQICYSSINPKAKAPCGHDLICGICHLRLRFLHGSTACPMCKTPNEQLVVDTTPKLFEEYPLWGNELGGDYAYNTQVGMFFPTEYYVEQVEPLFGHQCHDCDEYDGTTPDENIYEQSGRKKQHKKPPTPLRALQDHLRTKHRLALCQLCVDFKRDFISQLPRFTPSQLKEHLCKGDGSESGFKGHPLCEFCRPKRFYDLEKLHHHLQTDHYKCHVCDKQGKPNQYFKNYSSLEHHFDAMHFLCKDVQCLQARFVVFDNEIDLRGHELNVHGGTSTGSTKIQLEFRYRRPGESSRYENQEVPSESDFQYALDGQAFVPESIEEDTNQQAGAPNEATSHPLHWQRTNELRAHAAQIRQQQHTEVEAFPSLGGDDEPSSAPLNVGWSSSDTSRLLRPRTREEDFPSLQPPSSSTSMSAASAKLKANSGNSRQFAAMRSAASVAAAPAAASSSAAATASTNWTTTTTASSLNRESDLTMDNFPALGGGGGTRRYVAAEQLAKKKPPSINNSSDFPPPPKSTVRQHVLKQESKNPPPAMDNVLDFPPPPKDAAVVIEELKTTLGTTRYKQLKRLTKEFASNGISPQEYVDQARNLFDSNVDVYKYLPSLLESCPNEASAKQARRYVEELRTNNNTATLSKPNVAAAAASTSSWATVGATSSSNVNRAAVASQNTAAPKKSSTGAAAAWSSGGTLSSAARAKPVAVEAASSKPTKKSGGSKKKKSKQNDELRALAFGGK